jgi:hypothetical protein
MEILWQICLRAAEISILIFGILGATVSVLLLFFPDRIREARNWFDRIYNMDQQIADLNRYIETDNITYHHHIIFGICLIVGSVFVLIFLFFRINAANYSNLVIEIIINALLILGKITGFVGIILGFLLVFIPDQMKILETRMNAWVDTQNLVDKLNEFHPGLDDILLRYPFAFGVAGLAASIIIIALSFIGLFAS